MARNKGTENAVTTALIEAALVILEEEHPMTIRQLFYRLVSAEYIENTRADYQKVSRIMTKARDDGRCPFEWIVDRSRPVYAPQVWQDTEGYAEAVKKSYRKDYWHDQPEHVEIWVEKDAVIGSIADLADELGVTVRVGRGFFSTTRAHDIAAALYRIKKPTTIFYLGDHDPSGRAIEDQAWTRIQTYVGQEWVNDSSASSDDGIPSHVVFKVQRLAIHSWDIEEFNLPPLRVKTKDDGSYADPRARAFIADHGEETVELDALPPTELRRRIREAVEGKLDMAKWNRAVQVEKVELDNIIATVGQWRVGNFDGV